MIFYRFHSVDIQSAGAVGRVTRDGQSPKAGIGCCFRGFSWGSDNKVYLLVQFQLMRYGIGVKAQIDPLWMLVGRPAAGLNNYYLLLQKKYTEEVNEAISTPLQRFN